MRTHRQVLEKRQVLSQLLAQKTDSLINAFKCGEQMYDVQTISSVHSEIEDLRTKIRVLDWTLGIEVE